MTIVFDEAAADGLVNAAVNAASALRGQGSMRRGAADAAAQDFAGGHAELFIVACTIESQDRGRLARVLDDLAADVRDAAARARDEKARILELRLWQDREYTRVKYEALATSPASSPPVHDPMPPDTPITPPTISAVFTATPRTRVSSVAAGGTSSANPHQLKAFAAQSSSNNGSLGQESARVHQAWGSFVGSCSWVRLGTVTFVGGFVDYVMENRTDALWIEHIADAFQQAGASGALNSSHLDASWTTALNGPLRFRLRPPIYGSTSAWDNVPGVSNWQAAQTAWDRLRALDDNPPDWLIAWETHGTPPYMSEAGARALHRLVLLGNR